MFSFIFILFFLFHSHSYSAPEEIYLKSLWEYFLENIKIKKKDNEIRQSFKKIRRKINYSYRCPATGCNKNYKTISSLERHQRTHTGENPYVCPLCPDKFYRKDYLKKHIYKVHLQELERPTLIVNTIILNPEHYTTQQ